MMVWKALPHQAINTDPYIAQHDIDRGNITHTPQYTIHPIAERLTHEAYEAKHGQAMPEWDNYHMGSIARVAPRRDEVGRIITIPASNGNPEMQVDENWWQDKLMRDEAEAYRQFFDNMTPEDEEDMALFIGQQASGDPDYQLPSTDWQDKKTGEPMDLAMRLLKASMPGTAGYPEDEPCSMCRGTGQGAVSDICAWCDGTGERANWEDLRNKTLRDAAPVKLTDEHGLTDEEKYYVQQNLALPRTSEDAQFSPEFQQRNKGEPMEIAMRLLKASMPDTAGYPEDEPCSMCRGTGQGAVSDICAWCDGTGKRANWEDLRNKTLRDAAPVKPTDDAWGDWQLWEDEHGLTNEERTALAHNLPTDDDPDWQDTIEAGEPMDLAWRLLKEWDTPLSEPRFDYHGTDHQGRHIGAASYASSRDPSVRRTFPFYTRSGGGSAGVDDPSEGARAGDFAPFFGYDTKGGNFSGYNQAGQYTTSPSGYFIKPAGAAEQGHVLMQADADTGERSQASGKDRYGGSGRMKQLGQWLDANVDAAQFGENQWTDHHNANAWLHGQGASMNEHALATTEGENGTGVPWKRA